LDSPPDGVKKTLSSPAGASDATFSASWIRGGFAVDHAA
jgi:hypothetical protein